MVTFGEITQKNLRVNYVKDDMEGYKVVGNANYNKENKLTDAYGDIRDLEDRHIANFNVYGEGENARVNLNDCLAGMMSEAVEIAEITLRDLAFSYPQD
jgi:lysozyme family protein